MKRAKEWIVEQEGIRPAGAQDKCFYCNQLLGTLHKDECVIRERTIVIRMTVEYVITIPESWTPEQIENHRNHGSWCAINAIAELDRISEHNCLCEDSRFEYVREATAQDEEHFHVYVEDCEG